VSGIAVDSSGNAYVTGFTGAGFPTTAGAFQTVFAGGNESDAFVTKVNPTGSALVYSTYLGGSGADGGRGIAVDSAGNAYVTGFTNSSDFPTTGPAFQSVFGGDLDAFVTMLNATGSALIYSTYLGGSGSDGGRGIALDGSGNAYITGFTASSDFATTPGAFDTSYNGDPEDAIVAKIVTNTSPGSNVAVDAGNGVSVVFSSVGSPGETAATKTGAGPTMPLGFTFGSPPIFYDLTTTAAFLPTVDVCFTYDPTRFSNPNSLSLLHFENGTWVDVTISNNISRHVLCGRVTTFSFFAAAAPIPPASKDQCKGGG